MTTAASAMLFVGLVAAWCAWDTLCDLRDEDTAGPSTLAVFVVCLLGALAGVAGAVIEVFSL